MDKWPSTPKNLSPFLVKESVFNPTRNVLQLFTSENKYRSVLVIIRSNSELISVILFRKISLWGKQENQDVSFKLFPKPKLGRLPWASLYTPIHKKCYLSDCLSSEEWVYCNHHCEKVRAVLKKEIESYLEESNTILRTWRVFSKDQYLVPLEDDSMASTTLDRHNRVVSHQ